MSKIVLVTGCSTGIGRDLAQRLTQSGYAVAATARKVETLDDLQAGLKLPLDVTRPDSINAAVENVLQQFGRIDVLVNLVLHLGDTVWDLVLRRMFNSPPAIPPFA